LNKPHGKFRGFGGWSRHKNQGNRPLGAHVIGALEFYLKFGLAIIIF